MVKDFMSLPREVFIRARLKTTLKTAMESLRLGKASYKKYKAPGNKTSSRVTPNTSEAARCSKVTSRDKSRQATG